MNYCNEDLGIDPAELSGKEIVEHLDKRIQDVIDQIQASELWSLVTSPDSNPLLVQEVMKEIYLEIVMYQEEVTTAAIAMIGDMPRYISANTIGHLLHHQAEEFDHGEMALKDYVNIGGNEEFARNRRKSPTAFAIGAIWRMMCYEKDSFAVLGGMYLIECLTPIITEIVKPYLREKAMNKKTLGFIDYHSVADIEHGELFKETIEDFSNKYPQSKESICYGFEYFATVWPMPAWENASERAIQRLGETVT